MFAVIKTGGKQYLVEDGQTLLIERSKEKTPPFEVLFSDGKPEIKLEVIEETKGPKIKILKHRAKKHSRTRKGHRQKLVKVKVTFGGSAKSHPERPAKQEAEGSTP